ncbi:amidohydrolase [Phreatobacter aquaticus]|uniref:Amidohydrolase n=1 Tax=Phreatobacter aquaticus TaxID=2570229 RepID=A0A4D7QGE8_9HYPH|nr:amidohydrolase family protein [Phreatobacter aquaticus]QCK84534.1 amidohydrolase [Phreatobacter aquaticus]
MRIDAHQHVWTLARGDYGWLTPALGAIHRDFGPADLKPLLDAARIDRTILVQAAPTLAETEFMLGVAAATPFVAGVVGWVDMESADASARIARLARNPLLVGLRPMIHDIADPDWMLSASLAPAIAAMQRHDLVFDALVRPVHLSRLLTFADRHPGLSIVIDHGAKPDIAGRTLDPWRADMAAMAARPNVACKLSGLVTEAGIDWTDDDLRPVVSHLIACFGASRLIFGSDWPVVTLAAPYQRWINTAEVLTGHLNADERAAIFGGTAERIYLSRPGRL